jgi:cardiolipin synthase
VTIPNIVSVIRILLVPLFLWLLLARDDPAAAGWLLLAIGATDWIDGFLARRLNQVSAIGKVLDPTADRLAVGAAVVGGWIAGVLPWPVALAIVVREMIVTTVAAVLAIRLKTALEVRWVGKAGTFGLYGAITSFFVYAGWGQDVFRWLAWSWAIPALVFYYISAVIYIGDARRLIATGPPVSSDRSST